MNQHPLLDLANEWSRRIEDNRKDYEIYLRENGHDPEVDAEFQAQNAVMLTAIFELGKTTGECLRREEAAFEAAETTERANQRLTTVLHAMLDELQSDVRALPATPERTVVYRKIQDWRQAVATTKK